MGLKDRLSRIVSRKKNQEIKEKTAGMSKKKKVAFCIIGITLILVVGMRVSFSMSKAAAQKTAEMNRQTYIPVETFTVKTQTISSTILLNGKVQADKEAPVMVAIPGKVAEIHAKVGDKVKKDQVLFSLDKSDVLISYNQAAAVYQMAQAGYETSMRKYENDKNSYERLKELYTIGAVSKVELEQAELMASDSARQTIEGQLAQAQAAYESASKTLNDMDVKSPIDGILTSLDVSIGAMVSNASPAAKVVDLEKVFVTVSVSEKEINNVKRDQEVQVEVPSASKKVKGKIEGLSLAADSRGKYTLKTYIDNKDAVIKPGMFANVTLSTAAKDNVLVVPTDAVVFHKGRNVVYVANDKAAVEKEVITGLENGTETEIVQGLIVGDQVIIKGQNFLSEGSEIKVVVRDGVSAEEDSSQASSTMQTGEARNK